jgi:hypothetical protein
MPTTTLPKRSDLAERVASFNRRYKMLARWYFGSCFAIVAALAVAVLAGFQAPFGGWVSIVGLSGMFVIIFGGALLMDLRRSAIARQERLLCPSCGKPLIHANAKLALTTGRCAECGEPVVSDL